MVSPVIGGPVIDIDKKSMWAIIYCSRIIDIIPGLPLVESFDWVKLVRFMLKL